MDEDDKDELNSDKTNKLSKSQDRRSIKESININGGDEFQINAYTTDRQQDPSVSGLSDDRFVVVWQSEGQDKVAMEYMGEFIIR